jgi:DNA-binding transcriptional MocR family regulator
LSSGKYRTVIEEPRSTMGDWWPDLSEIDKPRYLAIADAIDEDIRNGRLAPFDRLPPQRKLARRLDIDFTTVARGYIEAQKRGLIESHVGRGTFVRATTKRRHGPMARHPEIVDLSMNLPPEPDDPELLDRMQDGLEALGRDLVYLMRYQGFGGAQADKDAAVSWLSRRGLAPQRIGCSSRRGHIPLCSAASACWRKQATSSCRKR